MRVGIDAHFLGRNKGGVETCVLGLIRALAGFDRENEYIIYVGNPHFFFQLELPPNFTVRILPVVNPWLERALLIPRMYVKDRLDVIHVQRALPFWGCQHSVVQIHDAYYKTHPDLFPFWKRVLLNPVFQWSGKKATKVVTVSQQSKEEIVRHYHIDPMKIEVVPNGVDLDVFSPLADKDLLLKTSRKFGIANPFVIYLGAIERHKNVHVLIQAFQIFKRICPGFSLVIVGSWPRESRRGYGRELLSLMERLGCRSDVILTGYVVDEERRSLLNAAKMLVLPSKVEGFGLPPLEAMACGIPTITASIPVMKEIYGDAALMVEPGNAEALADAMKRLATDEPLAKERVQRGFEVVKQYSWKRVAQRMTEVYRSALCQERS